ncbi:MAG TPA: RsmE family RNA methyltransferase, partial [Bryobacterales bacterium]|nr:RsmE family RNA methyltransferase [Bryobacterales bacterium]
HTVPKRVNTERLRANAIEAAEQCNLVYVPEVLEPVRLDRLLEDWPEERRIIHCDESAEVANPVEALRELQQGPLAVLIGPEGGFSDREKRLLRGLPFVHPISLGPRIMRADTAAVAALAIVQAVLGDWN